jgi:heme/copper-type cytochrome/quinol oxidase subunit 4
MSESHPVEFNSYLRRCLFVFVAAVCAVALMIWASYLPQDHFSWPLKVTLILIVACCNALVVAGFLMHLISEKKMVYTVLGFTVFFFAGLLALTVWAMHDFPAGTTH